jgi:hypothetical protein
MSGFGSITAGDNIVVTSITASILSSSTAQFTTITCSSLTASANILAGTTFTVGGGSAVSKMKVYSVNFTAWNSISGNATSQQTGTYAANSFSGMSTNDTLFVNGLGAQWSSSPIVITSITASAAGPLFTFRNTTSSAATPPLGVYKIFAITV